MDRKQETLFTCTLAFSPLLCVSVALWLDHKCHMFQLHMYAVMELLEGGVFITNAICFSYTHTWWWNCWKGASCCLASSASNFSRKLRPWTSWTSWCVLLTSCTARALCIAISNLRRVVRLFLPPFLLCAVLLSVCGLIVFFNLFLSSSCAEAFWKAKQKYF